MSNWVGGAFPLPTAQPPSLRPNGILFALSVWAMLRKERAPFFSYQKKSELQNFCIPFLAKDFTIRC
jgi:hypothetical protein